MSQAARRHWSAATVMCGVSGKLGRRRRLAGLAVLAMMIFGGVVPAAARATAITEFPLLSNSDPRGVTPGPDGNLWFTDGGSGVHAIGNITPSGTITRFTQGLASSPAPPVEITNGPDGNMWFTATGTTPNAIGKVTPSGAITEFVVG